MPRSARFRLLSVRLALLAVLLGALMPGLSQAVAAWRAGAAASATVCSAFGVRWVDASRLPDPADPSDDGAPASADACLYCTLQSHGGAPLPMAGAAAPEPTAGQAVQLPHIGSAVTATRWPAARPRGPPPRA